MTAQIDVSKVNVLADIGLPAANTGVSKLSVVANISVPRNTIGVSKFVMYALVNEFPPIRRKVGVGTQIGRFVRPV